MLTQLRYFAKSEADNNTDEVDGKARVDGASSSIESQRQVIVLEERTIANARSLSACKPQSIVPGV
jgi:hypothetical protein